MSNNFNYLRFRRTNSYRSRLLKVRIINNLITLLIIGAVGLILLTLFLFIWYSRDLPYPDKVKRKEGFSTVILDRNGKTIYDLFVDKNRISVASPDIPDFLKKATISIEDKDFYKHQGFDPKGILRALYHIITFQGVQGGSTLTQQLVKNVLLTSEQKITRKIKEFILAIQIERKYNKDEILQMYLNEAPYGGTMWGIESAAQGYFGKSAKDLTPLESAILAGFPQRPSYYSPFSNNPKAYIGRTEEVLRRMREDGNITQAQEYEYSRELRSVTFASESAQFLAPHFVMYVKKQLVDQFGEKAVDAGGLRVTTTLDKDLQEKAEKITKDELEKLKGLNASNGAAVVIDPKTGGILTYIGSQDYNSEDTEVQGKFDVTSMGYRQPGSALKPITYAAAFTRGYTPSSILMDTETHFIGGAGKADYIPKNYDGKFRGPTQIRFALANSINVPAVKMTALIGIREILKTAFNMGLTTLEPTDENVKKFGLSIVLGGGEVRLLDLVGAYGIFATGGINNQTYSISKVEDGNRKIVYEHKVIEGKRVISEDVSFLISNILSDNKARSEVFGERSYLVVSGHTVSVKTGTTDDKRDNWTIGYTPSVVAGVWVGNNDNSPMNPKLASGVTGAAPIWNRIMNEILKNVKDEQPKRSDNIIPVTIDSYLGGLPHEGKPTREEYFIKGTEPTTISPIYQKLKLSKSDNKKLANAVEIATGLYDEKEYYVFSENDPVSGDGKNRWQEGIDAWIGTQGDEIFHPPRDTSSNNENTVVVRIKSPADKNRIDGNDIHVVADARATKDIKKIEIYIDDSLKASADGNSIDQNLHIDNGVRKIKVKATNSDNKSGESEITIGVNTSPDPTSTPVPPTPVPTLVPTVVPSPT